MHNLVWLIVAISVGLIFGFLSGGIFSADYSSFWPALGSIGTLGAWYFLYQQSKATTEQLQVFKIATSRTEIRHSIDRIVEYLLDGDKVRFDRLSWINAAMEVDNISLLIRMLPEDLRVSDTERFGRLLDSKLPEDLFERRDGGTSLLTNEMTRVHKKGKGRYDDCDSFAGRNYLLSVFMFTREYEFRNPKDIEGFKFRRATFFYIDGDWNVFKCSYCQNSMKK
ncbi:hypothetical protein ACUFKZ_001146 [Vibrio fluvialis]|nr:hypothetical protein [Vibrio fluvialis]ELP3312209.1 hypothetical protein [Vibrio fluvialis]